MFDICKRNKQMILKDFYLDVKACIEAITSHAGFKLEVNLYTDPIFKRSADILSVLFKYESVDWEVFSEQTCKADVAFCIYIVFPFYSQVSGVQKHEHVFDLAQIIDRVILSRNPSKKGLVNAKVICKAKERQYSHEGNSHSGNMDWFIWEILYKATFVEHELRVVHNGIKKRR